MTRSLRSALLRRIAAGIALGLAGTFAIAGAASAHVRVDGPGATQGGFAVITFRVPTESDTASTVEVQVTFPSSTPLAYVSTQPKVGWTATVTKEKLPTPITTDDGQIDSYVSQVTWKAKTPADGIQPGQFDTFAVSAGPLPTTVTSLSFPTLQVYSDGSQVNWNEQQTGSTEPAHPAPVLTIAPAAAGSGSSSAPTASAAPMDMSDHGGAPAWPGVVGLIAGVVALIVAIIALVRTGRQTPTA